MKIQGLGWMPYLINAHINEGEALIVFLIRHRLRNVIPKNENVCSITVPRYHSGIKTDLN